MNDFQKEGVFEAFVARNRRLWVRLAYRVLAHREEAEDVVQETLAFLWEKGKLQGVERPDAYVARSVWLNAIKRRTRGRVHLPLEGIAEPAAPEREEPEGGGKAADPAHLEKVLRDLPEAQRQVIRMKYVMELSFKEIGENLQISMNTAGSRCRYALEALRKALGAAEGRKVVQKKKR